MALRSFHMGIGLIGTCVLESIQKIKQEWHLYSLKFSFSEQSKPPFFAFSSWSLLFYSRIYLLGSGGLGNTRCGHIVGNDEAVFSLYFPKSKLELKGLQLQMNEITSPGPKNKNHLRWGVVWKGLELCVLVVSGDQRSRRKYGTMTELQKDQPSLMMLIVIS